MGTVCRPQQRREHPCCQRTLQHARVTGRQRPCRAVSVKPQAHLCHATILPGRSAGSCLRLLELRSQLTQLAAGGLIRRVRDLQSFDPKTAFRGARDTKSYPGTSCQRWRPLAKCEGRCMAMLSAMLYMDILSRAPPINPERTGSKIT